MGWDGTRPTCGVPGLGLSIPVNGLGLMVLFCPTNGVLRKVAGRYVLPPKGRFCAELLEHEFAPSG